MGMACEVCKQVSFSPSVCVCVLCVVVHDQALLGMRILHNVSVNGRVSVGMSYSTYTHARISIKHVCLLCTPWGTCER